MTVRYKIIPAGTIQGLLVSTGKSKSTGSNRLWQYRCLVCGTGYVWKRPSNKVGISCGCLRSHFSAMWVKILRQHINREEAKAEYKDARERLISGMRKILKEDIEAGRDLFPPEKKQRRSSRRKSRRS